MDARSHEFMPRALLDSQFAALEDLEADEAHVLGDITQPLDVLAEMLELKLKPLEAVMTGAEGDASGSPQLREVGEGFLPGSSRGTRATGHRSHLCRDWTS